MVYKILFPSFSREFFRLSFAAGPLQTGTSGKPEMTIDSTITSGQ